MESPQDIPSVISGVGRHQTYSVILCAVNVRRVIVAMALGLDLSQERINWEPWDLTYPVDGKQIRIEVKSSSYLQAWSQNKPSVLNFGIRPTYLLEGDGQSTNTACRQSDILCVLCFCREEFRSDAMNGLYIVGG